MRRRGFLKALGVMAASVMVPLHLTAFGVEETFLPTGGLPLKALDASTKWMQLMYNSPTLQPSFVPAGPRMLVDAFPPE